MIRLLNLILFSTTLMFSTTSFSQPIVILEYRGSNHQNLSEDISNNIFMMDPDHTEKMQAAGMNSGDHVDNAIYPRFCLEKDVS